MKVDKIYIISFIICFLLALSIIYGIYRAIYKYNCEKHYTLCKMRDFYAGSKSKGRKFTYNVDGNEYEALCESTECIDAEFGDVFLIYFCKKEPSLCGVIEKIDKNSFLSNQDTVWFENPLPLKR